jgi:hypothetical protein
MYGKLYFYLLVSMFLFSCRTPDEKFYRLVKRHPHLLDFYFDSDTSISETISLDTQFIFKTKKDTVYFGTNRIERFGDTFRFYYKERPCTTYINTTTVAPVSKRKAQERRIAQNTSTQKDKKGFAWEIFPIITWLITLAFLIKNNNELRRFRN